MNERTLIILAACLLIAGLLIWKESARRDRKRLALRLLASLAAVGSLAMLIIPLYYTTELRSGAHLLLTAGYDSSYVSRVTRTDTVAKVYTLDPAIYRATHAIYKTRFLLDTLRELQILGWGLSSSELADLPVSSASFSPPSVPAGLQSVSWTPLIKSGGEFIAQGRYTAEAGQRLLLVGNGRVLDSIDFDNRADSAFALTVRPRQLGRDIFQLVALSGTDTLLQQPMPFELEPATTLRVLMLANVPGFESRFLKNWLADNHYAVASRVRITKGKFQQEFSNTSEQPLGQINARVLAKTDLIISDAAELRELSADEKSAIRLAVEDRGVGLVVRADSIADRSFYAAGFRPVSINRHETLLSWASTQKAALPVPLLTAIGVSGVALPLVSDQEQSTLAAVTLAGSGKIVFTTLANTYIWPLSGTKDTYASLWTTLLQSALRSSDDRIAVTTKSSFPVSGEPVELQVNKSDFRIDGRKISSATNMYDPEFHEGIYYPASSGWKTLEAGDSLRTSLFIYESNAWLQVRKLQRLNETKVFVANRSSDAVQKAAIPARKRMSVYPFFILFLIAMGYLWLENKYAAVA
jgi:hypothetical protein